MRKINRNTILPLLLVLLAGCVEKEESTPSTPAVPMPSNKAKIIKLEPITNADKNLLKDLFKKNRFVELSSLLITSPDESEKMKNYKKMVLESASAEDKKILTDISSHCLIEPEKVDKSTSDEKVGIEVQIQRSAQVQSKGSDSETPCPISYVKDAQALQVVLESNLEILNREFEATKNNQVYNKTLVRKKIEEKKTEVTDILSKDLRGEQEISKYQLSRESKTGLTLSGSHKNQVIKVKSQFSGNAQIEHIDSTIYLIDFSGEEYLENNLSDYFMTVTIELPQSQVIIQAVKSMKNELTEYYLNGELISKSQLLEEIGLDIESYR